MAKTIAVSDDVYELLSKAKLPGESFSDAIRRSLRRGGNLMDVFGSRTITKEDWRDAETLLERAQYLAVRRLKDRRD